jgi:ELWxxDGT repeat protein
MLPNIVFFEGEDATGTVSLWETDGTVSGTFELTDTASPPPLITGEADYGFVPNPGVSLDLTVFNNQVLFDGRIGPGKIGPFTLWTSDGTASGTIALTPIVGAKSSGFFSTTVTPGFTVFGAEVLFRGIDTGGASAFWMTNGTALGTTEIAGINGAASTGVNPTDITVFGDAALFNGADTAGHLGLWTTDGTAGGTQELTSIGGAAATGLNPTDMTVFNGEVLFNGADANGLSGLWMTNGSAAGTHELLARAGGSSDPTGLGPTDMTVFGSEVLFSGIDANGLTGLWVSDGTAGGAHEIFSGATAAKDPHGLSPTNLTVFNGEVFFNGFDQFGRHQLWETNGTAAGTQMLTVAGESAGGLNPSNMEIYNDQLLFQGNGQQRVGGLWTTNGTAAGTQEVTPISGVYPFGFGAEDLTALTPGSSSPPPPVAPTIAGTVPGQTTISEGPVRPFAHVKIVDTNVGATDTLTIALGGVGGTLTDGTGFSSLTTVGAGVYRLSGTAGAITSELDALIFTPTAGKPNTTSTTTFRLSDLSSANGAPVVDSTTNVLDTDPPPPPVTSSILWQNTSGQASIWEMGGNTLVGGGPVTPSPGPSFRAVGTGQFNVNDTNSDILWQNANTGQASIWEMNGNSLIGGGPVSPNPGLAWHAVGTGDFNHDGLSDILWQNTNTGQASIWEMSGNNRIGGGPVTPNPGTDWQVIGTGDFNKDGFSDILWQNANTGQVSVWEMNGNNRIGGGPVTPNPGTAWQAIGTGDFNHDGFSDILLQNKNIGAVSVWEMNGNNLIGGGPVANPGTGGQAIGTGAGGSDILLQNASGQASIWEMNGNTIAGGGPVTPNPGPSWHAIGLT